MTSPDIAPPFGSEGLQGSSGFRRLLQNRIAALIGILLVYNLAFAFIKPASFLNIDNYPQHPHEHVDRVLHRDRHDYPPRVGCVLDLSLGANMALAGILCGMLIKFAHFDIATAMAVSLAASLAMGGDQRLHSRVHGREPPHHHAGDGLRIPGRRGLACGARLHGFSGLLLGLRPVQVPGNPASHLVHGDRGRPPSTCS